MINNTIIQLESFDIKYQNSKISYNIKGVENKKSIILLHGYLESKEIWNDFADELSKQFKVISIDIPGHGQSELISEEQSFFDIADLILFISDSLKINKFFLVGHSMGGYIALAFAKKYTQRLSGFCLFHSTPFPDNEEKRALRNVEIDFVKMGKKNLLCVINIPKIFADINTLKFEKDIDNIVNIAKQTSDLGIIVALNSMKNRENMSGFLYQTELPTLIILGLSDNYISYEKVGSQIKLPKNGKMICLENSGHIGFIEEKERTLEVISKFIN